MTTKKKKKEKAKKNSNRPTDRSIRFEAMWAGRMSELVNKHNEMTTAIASMEVLVKQLVTSTASEIGKLYGTLEGHMQALSGLDLNILASAEVLKVVMQQLGIFTALFQKMGATVVPLTDAEVEEAKKWAEQNFNTVVAASFRTVKDRLELEAKEFREAQEKAEAEKAESKSVETELKKAMEVDTALGKSASGGPGSDYPEGAEIFRG